MKWHEVQEDSWLSISDVAEIFDISEHIVRADVKSGGLKSVQFGRTVRIPGWAVINKLTDEYPAPELPEPLTGASESDNPEASDGVTV